MLGELGQIRDIKAIKAIANACQNDIVLFEGLCEKLISGNDREKNMASWTITHALEKYGDLAEDRHHRIFLDTINSTKSGTLKRNLIRNWQFISAESDALNMEIIETVINHFTDRKQDLAVRVFAITALERQLDFFPEMAAEVLFHIEREMPQASPSFKVRADRFKKAARKRGLI